jgi:DNA-3-methyladenine glycosylase
LTLTDASWVSWIITPLTISVWPRSFPFVVPVPSIPDWWHIGMGLRCRILPAYGAARIESIVRMVRPRRSTRYRLVPRSELPIHTVSLARSLIGKILVRQTTEALVSGRIVETEAYPVGDPAGHAYHGMTRRNHSLFLCRGHAYVYLVYGRSYMLNVVSEGAGVGAGVLIRALELMEGNAILERQSEGHNLRQVMRGPGRLGLALQIDCTLDGIDLCRHGPLWLASDDQRPAEIGRSVRIGISRGANLPLRFYVRGSEFVSGPTKLNR